MFPLLNHFNARARGDVLVDMKSSLSKDGVSTEERPALQSRLVVLAAIAFKKAR